MAENPNIYIRKADQIDARIRNIESQIKTLGDEQKIIRERLAALEAATPRTGIIKSIDGDIAILLQDDGQEVPVQVLANKPEEPRPEPTKKQAKRVKVSGE